MRKLLFDTIKTALFAITDGNGQPVIQYVERWNNQVEYAEEEQPFYCPAVFVEFAPINWRGLPHGVREAEVQITLHVVIDSRVGRWSETNTVFEFLDVIHKALFGLHVIEDKRTMDSLSHLQSITDSDHGELEDNRETYTCHVTDATAYPYTAMKTTGIVFDIGAELKHPAGI